MKLRFYCDVYGPFGSGGLMAMTNPGQKIGNAKRFAFDVTIPDGVLFQVDVESPEPAKVTLIEDPS